MKESELETMRKSFKTVKDRSSKIKNSSSIKRLEKRVREIFMICWMKAILK